MSDTSEELFDLSKKLKAAGTIGDDDRIETSLKAIEKAAEQIGLAFSGSWLGYHANVYYQGLHPPPPGAHFSQEWGLKEMLGDLGTTGNWQEYDGPALIAMISKNAGEPDLAESCAAARKAADYFEEAKAEVISILLNELHNRADVFLENLKDKVENLRPMTKREVLQHWSPKGQIMTRDSIAAGQGNRPPPHLDPLAEVISIRHSFAICNEASKECAKAASHIERRNRKKKADERVGTNVFIGHGQSASWRELKDFIQDRLKLPWDEFNRVPVAGVTNIARLSEMLESAAIAFLIMTAEDELADGDLQARMNVIHEAGLFQGRLGFSKAIVLLEDGCKEFSNIQGLGQIRFPKNNIGAVFEEVRRVLEREKLIE